MPSLSFADFADLFGTEVELLSASCCEEIAKHNWNYSFIEGSEREALIIELLERIEARRFTVVSNEDKSRWENGWRENLSAFKVTGGDIGELVPKYIRPGLPLRLRGEFIRSEDPNFELNWYTVFRNWLFSLHLARFEKIFEFGCGSGHNVAYLAKNFPRAQVIGLDWARPSVEIINTMRDLHGMNVRGEHFDFFHPNYALDIPKGSAVVTMGALEQTGTSWGAFVEFLRLKQPAYCVHAEPIYEWYDRESGLHDYTAAKAHEVRNFLRGFSSEIVELEKTGIIRIIRAKRSSFGSLMMEGYSQLIWEFV